MSFNHPNATELNDHSRGNFKGATYVVKEKDDSHIIERSDKEKGEIEQIKGDDSLKEARTRAQVMAKRNSDSNTEALVRIKPTGEVLGFGGKYEEEKRTPTPEEDLKELDDIGLRDDDPVGECISKEMSEGMEQDQAVAICLSKRDNGELDDQSLSFNDQDASRPNPDIDVNDDVQETLEDLVEKHNKEVQKESRKATIGQLKSVYMRGRGAFTQTSRPQVDSATQWALARVKNAYLPLLKEGEPPNEDYVQDNDLLPEGHPESTRGEMSDQQRKLTNINNDDNKIEGINLKGEWTKGEIVFEEIGEFREIVHLMEHPEKGFIEIERYDDPEKDEPVYYVNITKANNEGSRQKVKNLQKAKERAQKRIDGEIFDEDGNLKDRRQKSLEDEQSREELIELTEAEALMDELNTTQVLEKFENLTELSPDQLEKWKENKCHKEASGEDADKHIKRNKFLLEEATDQLSLISKKVPEDIAMESAKKHVPEDRNLSYRLAVFQMMRTNSFLSRMYGTAEQHDLDPIPEGLECPSELEISLRNWAGSVIENPRI